MTKFYRSRTTKLVILGVLLLACLAGVLGYCYVGPVSIEEQDLASASVITHEIDGRFSPDAVEHPIDLTDPSKRAELAALMNGLHRWRGEATEGMPRASLKVALLDGLEYSVVWWQDNDDLELVIAGDEPDREHRRIWVRSAEMKRYLTRYIQETADTGDGG